MQNFHLNVNILLGNCLYEKKKVGRDPAASVVCAKRRNLAIWLGFRRGDWELTLFIYLNVWLLGRYHCSWSRFRSHKRRMFIPSTVGWVTSRKLCKVSLALVAIKKSEMQKGPLIMKSINFHSSARVCVCVNFCQAELHAYQVHKHKLSFFQTKYQSQEGRVHFYKRKLNKFMIRARVKTV